MARIVYAEDDRDNRYVIAALLQLGGHDVRLACNGREALDLIREDLPDLLILDLMMPEMNGFETCTEVRRDAQTAALPVVALTALDAEYARRNPDARFDAYIAKPFRVEELHRQVHALVGQAA